MTTKPKTKKKPGPKPKGWIKISTKVSPANHDYLQGQKAGGREIVVVVDEALNREREDKNGMATD